MNCFFMSLVPNEFLLCVHKLSRDVVVVAGLEVFGIGVRWREMSVWDPGKCLLIHAILNTSFFT